MLKSPVFFLFFLFLGLGAIAQSPVIYYSNAGSSIEIGDKVQVLEDKKDSFSIGQIIVSDKFIPNPSQVLKLGFSKSSFWIKAVVKNNTESNHLLVELSQPSIDMVEFYEILPDGKIKEEKLSKWHPLTERSYKTPNYIVDLKTDSARANTFFIKLKGDEPIQLTLKLGSEDAILLQMGNVDFFSGIYIGIMVVMILYNLFIFLTVRDKSYLYYILYITFLLFTQTSYGQKYLWPGTPWIEVHSLLLFSCLAGITSLLFMHSFLNASKYEPRLIKVSYLFYGLYICCIAFALFDRFVIGTQIMEPVSALVSVYILIVAIRIFRKGNRSAKFFLIGWTIFLIGVVLFIIKDLGILPYNNYTRYTLQVGSVFDVVLLSLGFADRIKILNREKEEKSIQLEKSNKELNRFAYSASHDLKAPISTITSIINLAKIDHTYEKDSYLQMIESSILQLNDFTTSIINYFLNQNKEQLITSIVFESLMLKLIEQIKAFRDTKGVDFRINIQQNNVFWGDSFCIHMILNNLISNSIVHGNTSIKETIIDIEIAVAADSATIKLQDNGKGIAKEHLPHIFEMFYRASATGKGSGLGLYIVKESVETLGGTVSVSSVLGEGTCFTIHLPSKSKGN